MPSAVSPKPVRASRRQAAPAPRGHDDGQIMLLAAILLVLGLIALAGMVARVALLASVTSGEAGGSMLQQAGPLMVAAEDLPEDLQALGYPLCASDHADFDAALDAALRHIGHVQGSNGFLFEYDATYDDPASPTELTVEFTLRDGRLEIEAEIAPVPVPAC